MRVQNLFSIEGKTVLITGGSSGIGSMIARGCVEAGAKVYISSRKQDVCESVAEELSKSGTCLAIPADLSTEAECNRLGEEITGLEGKLDVLINNAGCNWGEPMETFPDSAWDKVLALNVKAVFQLTRKLVPTLEKAARVGDPARVINVGSIDGIKPPMLDTFSYSASKAAVHHLTRVLAKKLAPRNITVNAIAPGPFESRMMHATIEAFEDSIVQGCPMKRLGEPEDMAGVAIYLASRAGAYVTGAIIPVDGGISTTS
jgi:NAD(P)-dependent dehydrogenase (short-subunit alcohol dehydrogenase family)